MLSAQLVTEVGVAHEMGYHPDERRRIAIHEAGHALTAVLRLPRREGRIDPTAVGGARPGRPR